MNILKKLNEIKENKRVKLRHYEELYGITLSKSQLKLIESKDRYIEKRFMRRTGRTTALVIKAMEYAINNERSHVLVLSNSSNQSRAHMNLIADLTDNKLSSQYISGVVRNPNVVRFKNGSEINFVSCRSIENSRGRKIDCLVIDGTEYISEHILISVCACMSGKPNSQLIITS